MTTPAVEEQDSAAALVAYRRRLSRWLMIGAVVLVLGLGWADVVASSGGGEVARTPLPGFALSTLAGEPLDETALTGHVTVVNFWASWCPPCRSEAPVLARVAEETEGAGVRFLGVLHQDRPEPAREFAERFGLHFPTVVDDGSLAAALGVRAIPMTFVVDGAGRVTARHFGPITESQLRVLIEDAAAADGRG